jgi:hypothetical protein
MPYKNKDYHKLYYQKHKKKLKKRSKQWRKENLDKVKKRVKIHYLINKSSIQNYKKKWRRLNIDDIKAKSKIYRKKNQKRITGVIKKYQLSKLKRIPKWSDLKAIELFYKNCPKGYVVDHIIPLQGKNVSGLHVLNNLQYLTHSENCSKGNRFEVKIGY